MSTNRRMGAAAASLLGIGLILMIVPPIARDGFCGITGCADQVPVIAVSRVSANELAIVVPDEAAPLVRTVELLQGSAGSGAQEWLIRRSGTTSNPSTFVMGSEPKGFRTVAALASQPVKGVWTAQVGFRCTTASLPFDPRAVAIGEVRSWDGVMVGNDFAPTANTSEHCATNREGAEVTLLFLGAALAVIGAVIGIVVVLRRPVRFPEDPDDEFDSFPGTADDIDPADQADQTELDELSDLSDLNDRDDLNDEHGAHEAHENDSPPGSTGS